MFRRPSHVPIHTNQAKVMPLFLPFVHVFLLPSMIYLIFLPTILLQNHPPSAHAFWLTLLTPSHTPALLKKFQSLNIWVIYASKNPIVRKFMGTFCIWLQSFSILSLSKRKSYTSFQHRDAKIPLQFFFLQWCSNLQSSRLAHIQE